jgi:hypothetical protein
MEPRAVSAVCLSFLFALPSAAAPVPTGEPRIDPVEMRTLTTLGHVVLSADAYRIDHGQFPGPTDGFVSAEVLRPLLSPVYIRDLPVLDGWGGTMLYASNGTRMALVSLGPDGVADREYVSLDALEPVEGAGDDLVWSDGRLVICPAHIGRFQNEGAQ